MGMEACPYSVLDVAQLLQAKFAFISGLCACFIVVLAHLSTKYSRRAFVMAHCPSSVCASGRPSMRPFAH